MTTSLEESVWGSTAHEGMQLFVCLAMDVLGGQAPNKRFPYL